MWLFDGNFLLNLDLGAGSSYWYVLQISVTFPKANVLHKAWKDFSASSKTFCLCYYWQSAMLLVNLSFCSFILEVQLRSITVPLSICDTGTVLLQWQKRDALGLTRSWTAGLASYVHAVLQGGKPIHTGDQTNLLMNFHLPLRKGHDESLHHWQG